MYRTYCDPFSIEQKLDEVRAYVAEHPDDFDAVCELYELEDELRFAWDDDEYDGCDYF